MINPPPKHKQAPIRPIITSSFKDSEDDSDFNLKAPSTRGNSATSSTHSFNSQTTEEPVIATDHLPFKVPNLRENHLRRQQALEKAQQQTNAAAFLQMKQGKFDPRNKIIIPPARIIIADFSRPHKRPNPVRKFSTVNQKENKEKKTEKKKKTSLKILNHGPMRFAAPAVPAGGATAAAKSNWKKFKQSVGLSIALKAMFSTTNKNGEKKMLGGGNPSLFAGISKSMMASRNESKAVSRIGSRVGSRIGSQVNSRVGSRVGSRKTSRSGSRAGSARKRSANVNASSVTDGPEENEVDKNIIKNSIAVVVESPTKDADIKPIKVIPEPPKVEQQALQEPKSFIKRVLMLKQRMEQEKKAQEEEQQRRLQLETQKLTAESMEIGGPISQTDESDVPKITIGLPIFTVQSASNEDLSSEQKDTNKNIPVFNIETVPDEDPTNDSNPTINIDIIEEADDTEEADSSAINANIETVSSPPISKLDKSAQSSTSLLNVFPSSPTRNSTTRSRKRSALGSGFLLSASNSGLPGRRHRPSAHKIDRTAAANLIFGNGEKSDAEDRIHETAKNVDAVLSTERKEKIEEAEKIVELFDDIRIVNTDTDEKTNRPRTYWSMEEYRKMKRDFEEKMRLEEEEFEIKENDFDAETDG
ncbi:hypothetical protein HK098_002994 [Nowakowskiella sp. JEL0407]|nr:hypothetical protein HK098_002994 [Nowakowskiella sp. JEL0407]